MADVQALCQRVIVIHHGRILFDGALAELSTRFDATKTIGVDPAATAIGRTCRRYGEVRRDRRDGRTLLRVARADAPEVDDAGSCATCRSPT